ncbi:putative zinc-or iron-chelating domain containing protein [Helianthus annuus]|nr:putative zinc-or iron-chelating domain containing protein [Helianthus annuus]KAJ0729081.1 putative zinc-or iron-chelating domain containing protein [Helianthus annuus]
MSRAMLTAVPYPIAAVKPSATEKPRQVKLSTKTHKKASGSSTTAGFGAKKKEALWQCVTNCGACCKLDKGPSFPSPEEIFEDSSDIQLYKSLVGSDGWCVHYEKSTRTCSIYGDRPYFCRVEPHVFETLYGIPPKKFNNEACSSCIDTIKAVYGPGSEELDKFKNAIRN